jgi:hypothetical protein
VGEAQAAARGARSQVAVTRMNWTNAAETLSKEEKLKAYLSKARSVSDEQVDALNRLIDGYNSLEPATKLARVKRSDFDSGKKKGEQKGSGAGGRDRAVGTWLWFTENRNARRAIRIKADGSAEETVEFDGGVRRIQYKWKRENGKLLMRELRTDGFPGVWFYAGEERFKKP